MIKPAAVMIWRTRFCGMRCESAEMGCALALLLLQLQAAAPQETWEASAYGRPMVMGGRVRPVVLIASDLPLQGPQAAVTRAMVDAIGFVLQQHRFRAGAHTVGYQSSNPRRDGKWRRIVVRVAGHEDFIIRHKIGYYAG